MYIRITAYDVLDQLQLHAAALETDSEGQLVAVWSRSATVPLARHARMDGPDALNCVAEELTNMAYSGTPWDTTGEHR